MQLRQLSGLKAWPSLRVRCSRNRQSAFVIRHSAFVCPRRESNPHLRFRKPSFYPLNYGDDEICEVRFANADCPAPSNETPFAIFGRDPTHIPGDVWDPTLIQVTPYGPTVLLRTAQEIQVQPTRET